MRPVIVAMVVSFAIAHETVNCPPLSNAGWGSGGCAPVGVPEYKRTDAGNGYEWREYPGTPGQVFLWKNGVQVAGWNRKAKEYRKYDSVTGKWGEPAAAPWAGCVDSCTCDCCGNGCDCQNHPCGCDNCTCVVGRKPKPRPKPRPKGVGAVADPKDAMDLPAELREWFRNPDGSCVQCSIGMCGMDQNVPAAATLLWDTEYGPKVRGGSNTSRVARYCDARGIRAYNVTGTNTWDWMKWAALTGRGAAIGAGSAHFQTLYGYDPATSHWRVCNNNSPQKIDDYDDEHFRRLHLASGQWCVILNYPPRPESPEYVKWWGKGYGQASDGEPQVERDEVIRRGDFVQMVGMGPRAYIDELFAQAVAPPADDSAKWFVYIITMQGCQPCERLKADWNKSADLLAFAKPDDPANSWAHFTIYDKDDTSQAFRFSKIQLTSFPTVIVQPPRNKAFGDPKTVVFQHTGYDGDARKLASAMSTAIKRYVATLPKRDGVAQGVRPPWSPPPKPSPNPPVVIPDQPLVVPGPNIPPDPTPTPMMPQQHGNIAVAALSIFAALAAVFAMLAKKAQPQERTHS